MPETVEQTLAKYKEKINIAWTEYKSNNLDKAEAICDALVIEFHEFFEPFYLLGHIYFDQEKLSQALDQFSKSLEKDKENKAGGHINYWIGKLYSKYSIFEQKSPLYDIKKAREHYRKARDYKDYPADVIYQIQHDCKNDQEEIKLYEEGINKFPDEIGFYILLSNTLKRSNAEKGIEILNQALEKGLKSSSLYYNIGEFYFHNDQFSKSRDFFSEALTLNEHYSHSNYAINYAIGNTFFNEGNFIHAEKYYRKSFEESINNDSCWFGFFGLILIYSEQNNLQEAQKLINEIAIDKSIFFEEGMFGGGPFWLDSQVTESIEFIHDIKKVSAALKKLKFSEKNSTFLCKLWLVRALLAKHLNNHSDRYTTVKNSLKHLSAETYEFIYAELSSIYYDLICQKIEKKQDVSSTIELFKGDLKDYPKIFTKYSTQIIDTVIDKLFKLKSYREIVELYYLFNEDQITEARVWFEVAFSLNHIKESKEAKKAYEKYIKQKGESSAALNNLANIYKSENDLIKAIELYKRGLKIDPNDEILINNLNNTLKQLEDVENENNQKKALDSHFKSALNLLKKENDFVLDKLNKFILNVKREEHFKNWAAPIQKYKFPILMGTDKQKAESLRTQWLNKNYIQESNDRDEHNVIIYFINPYLETEITKIHNTKIPENWISGFDNVTIGKLEEIGYFELISRIQKTNKKFKPLLERDFNELVFNYVMQNEKATIVLSGSLIELVLTYHCEKKKITQIPYLDSKGNTKNKKLYDCVLNDLILYAEKHLFFGSDFPHLSNLSRIYRNFIHPGRELKDKLDKPKCDLCFISTTEILRKIL